MNEVYYYDLFRFRNIGMIMIMNMAIEFKKYKWYSTHFRNEDNQLNKIAGTCNETQQCIFTK